MTSRPSGSRLVRKILIVDDSEATCDLFAEHFRQLGDEVATAADGNDAIATALRLKPDVIVIDLCMPALDGADTIAILRSYPTTMDIPIIVCTGQTELLKKRALTYSAVVMKPCLPADLERAVDEALGGVAESDAG